MSASVHPARAGQLDCVCSIDASGDDAAASGGTVLLAIAFSLSVLSQVIILSVLPLAGLSLAPSRAWATLPYAVFYAGAAAASVPASLLLDAFGRRAAFSLGAGLGTAGGLILTWALVHWHFGALVLGAFWLGIAGGFSLFYRHAAAGLRGKGARALLLVFGAATLAGLAAPTLARAAEAWTSPQVFVGMAAMAALAHVGSLVVTATLPRRRRRTAADPTVRTVPWRSILLPTIIGTLGWFAMTALMGATPIAMVGCGLAEAVSGVVAWHVIAMYAPSLALAALPLARPAWITAGGSLVMAGAVVVFAMSGGTGGFSLSATLLGTGWSLTTLGTTLWAHQGGAVSRRALGFHDASLLGGALLGALASAAFA